MTKPFCEKALREKAIKRTKKYLGKRYKSGEWLTENYEMAYTVGAEETLSELRELLDDKSLYDKDLTPYQKAFANGRNHHIDEMLVALSDSRQEEDGCSPSKKRTATPASPKKRRRYATKKFVKNLFDGEEKVTK